MQITNKLQINIMRFVDSWVRKEKTPVPRTEIISNMEEEGVKSYTAVSAINSLIRKRFIRRSVGRSNKTYYVQLGKV